MNKNDTLFREVEAMIKKLRRRKDGSNTWELFQSIVENNIDEICRSFNTRWLISICDTYADFGDPISRRNALLVVQTANFEKLWATYLLMYDMKLSHQKVDALKKNKIIPLWDGMYSFNINHGDMTNNFFRRVEAAMKETPVIKKIWDTVLLRLDQEGTTLGNLNEYHRRLFDPNRKMSVFRIMGRKIRQWKKGYKL